MVDGVRVGESEGLMIDIGVYLQECGAAGGIGSKSESRNKKPREEVAKWYYDVRRLRLFVLMACFFSKRLRISVDSGDGK